MVWIAFAAMIVVCVVAAVSIATRRRTVDRGSVSAHWIAQHRLEPRSEAPASSTMST